MQAGQSEKMKTATLSKLTVHIELYFLPEGEKFPITIGRFEFSAHGAGGQGPNTSTVYTEPYVVCTLKSGKSGTLMATSFCNIHGLWTSSVALKSE